MLLEKKFTTKHFFHLAKNTTKNLLFTPQILDFKGEFLYMLFQQYDSSNDLTYKMWLWDILWSMVRQMD